MNPLLIRRRGMMTTQGSGSAPEFHTYLVFDGTAYIETDIILPQDFSIRAAIGNEARYQQAIFSAYNGSNFVFALWMNSSTNINNRVFSVRYDSTSTLSSSSFLPWNKTRYNIYMTPFRFGYGFTVADDYTKGSVRPTSGLNIGRPLSTSTPYTGKTGAFRIYDDAAKNADSYNYFDNYTPIYTLTPCIYNGEAGLWCNETSRFYGNTAGAGVLTVDD